MARRILTGILLAWLPTLGAHEALGQDTDDSIPEGAISSSEPLKYGNESNESGLFLGAGLAFGQSRSTEPGSSPGLSTFATFEPGFQMSTGSWSRLEASVQLFSGRLQFRNPDVRGGKVMAPVTLGVLARVGYGYSLGNKLFGVVKLGVGPTMLKYESKVGSDTFKSDTVTGITGQLGYVLVMPITDALDVTGGFTMTHLQADVDEVKLDGERFELDYNNVIANLYQVELGLRLRI